MKLWTKGFDTNKEIERFTVGKDREMDLMMAKFDVTGSIAHIKMLQSINLLSLEEHDILKKELLIILDEIKNNNFQIEENIEDVHSQVELLLTRRVGEIGKKIHSGRSRNDQVLLDLKLFIRDKITDVVKISEEVFNTLIELSEKYKDVMMPGYTHYQVAMPSSFGLWFACWAESLIDDLTQLEAAYKITNKNPLGSAAGYGSSFPINRTRTTELLGFESLNFNVVYAQMGRGKAERITAMAMANIADTLAKLSMDACLFMNQNFGFIQFPDTLTTGSSIMPHKKNPDVFELIRSYCNRIKALPNEIMLMTTNLPSGYHRDLQLLKQHLFPTFSQLKNCIDMDSLMIENIEIKKDLLGDTKYQYLFSVEEVNKLVNAGMPFRDAYKKIGLDIEAGKFNYTSEVKHTHEGSIGNLCTSQIADQMKSIQTKMGADKVQACLSQLLK